MTDITNDRLDELDELRGLGEDDDSVDESFDAVVDAIKAIPDITQDTKSASSFGAKFSQSDTSSDDLDELRDLGGDDNPVTEKPVLAVQSKKPVSPFGATSSESETGLDDLDDFRDLGGDDSPVTEKPVLAVETKATQPENPADNEKQSEAKPVDKPVSTEKVSISNTGTEEKPVVAVEAKAPEKATIAAPPAPKAEKTDSPATPVPAPMSKDGEIIFNPTFSLKIFLTLRHFFIKFFNVILTGIAIILEQTIALYQTGIFGKIVSPFRAVSGMISNRMPTKYRKVFYAVIAILCFGLPSSYVFAILASGSNPGNSAFAQTVNINQVNAVTVNQGIIAQLFTPTVQLQASDIEAWTSGTTITPHMLAVVIQLESCGNPSVQGGLFGVGDDNFNDPDTQAIIAVEKLQSAMSLSNNNFALALAIYAEGERVLTDDFGTWALQTRDMFMIGGIIYNEAEAGNTSSSDLNSWLQNTGSVLCTALQTTQNS